MSFLISLVYAVFFLILGGPVGGTTLLSAFVAPAAMAIFSLALRWILSGKATQRDRSEYLLAWLYVTVMTLVLKSFMGLEGVAWLASYIILYEHSLAKHRMAGDKFPVKLTRALAIPMAFGLAHGTVRHLRGEHPIEEAPITTTQSEEPSQGQQRQPQRLPPWPRLERNQTQ